MVLTIAIVGGPLGFLVGGLLAPAVHNSGQATQPGVESGNEVVYDYDREAVRDP